MSNNEVCLGAKGVKDPGEFHGDIACTDHGHPLGQGFNVEETVRVDTVLSTGNLVTLSKSARHAGLQRVMTHWYGWTPANCDHKLLRADLVRGPVVPLDLDRVLVDKLGHSLVVVRLGVRQIPLTILSATPPHDLQAAH